MKIKTAIRVNRDGEARIVSTTRYRYFIGALMRDLAKGDGLARAGADGDACETFCEEHGGVRFCGSESVLCQDGTGGVIAA